MQSNSNIRSEEEGSNIRKGPDQIKADESNNLKIINLRLQTISNLDNPLEILSFAKNLPLYNQHLLTNNIERSTLELTRLEIFIRK